MTSFISHVSSQQTLDGGVDTNRPVQWSWEGDVFPLHLTPSCLFSPPLSVPPINFVACPENLCVDIQHFPAGSHFSLYLKRTASFFGCHLTGKKKTLNQVHLLLNWITTAKIVFKLAILLNIKILKICYLLFTSENSRRDEKGHRGWAV